jgi:hypothetical protein
MPRFSIRNPYFIVVRGCPRRFTMVDHTPMARAIIGGLTSSVLLTVFIVPAAHLLVYGRKQRNVPQN